ncbi:hypothetical protein C7M84_015062 [Penaeus vannamei]|uniref:Uncharacterized protein n=1 Tax=Penaeus vannamei TaxID=6689 RepID=A0A3R7NU97_PENVA|nr:hypothetical protein C7M84_015062 [Penaeus vannamei]
MMSFKQWLALLGIYTIYMLIGAAVFISLEKDNEMAGREELLDLKGRVIDFVTGLDNESRPGAEVVLVDVGGVCGHDFLAAEADVPLTWINQLLDWPAGFLYCWIFGQDEAKNERKRTCLRLLPHHRSFSLSEVCRESAPVDLQRKWHRKKLAVA